MVKRRPKTSVIWRLALCEQGRQRARIQMQAQVIRETQMQNNPRTRVYIHTLKAGEQHRGSTADKQLTIGQVNKGLMRDKCQCLVVMGTNEGKYGDKQGRTTRQQGGTKHKKTSIPANCIDFHFSFFFFSFVFL